MSEDGSNRSERSHLLYLVGPKGRVPRFKVDFPLKQGASTPKFPARIRNLSAEGAFIETLPESKGRILDLEFAFPNQKGSFLITGQVLWFQRPSQIEKIQQHPIGMGVKFLKFIRGTPRELERYLLEWSEIDPVETFEEMRSSTRHLPQIPEPGVSYPEEETPIARADTKTAAVYGNCLYSLHTLEDQAMERSLEEDLEGMLEKDGKVIRPDFSKN